MKRDLTPTEETKAHYRTMRSDELIVLARAFLSDRANADRPESIAFIDGRLELIATILDERKESIEG